MYGVQRPFFFAPKERNMELEYYLHMLERAFKDPVVIYDNSTGITYDVLHEVFYERSKQVLESYAANKPITEATDLEAFIYLFSLGPLMDSSLMNIYRFLEDKLVEHKEEKLKDEDEKKLRRLKRWLQDLKDLVYHRRSQA